MNKYNIGKKVHCVISTEYKVNTSLNEKKAPKKIKVFLSIMSNFNSIAI